LDLTHPLLANFIVPLSVALASTALIRSLSGVGEGQRLASAGIGVGLLAAYLLSFGVPDWPARSGVDKLPFLVAILFAGGTLADIWRPPRWLMAAATVAAVAAITLWFAWPQLGGTGLTKYGLLSLAALLAVLGLVGLNAVPAETATRPAMLIAAGLAIAGASFQAGSLFLMQNALALAAAMGGFALLNWPTPRVPLGVSGLSVGGLGGFALALLLLLLLLTRIPPAALLPLPFVFAAGLVGRRLPVPRRFERDTIEPVSVFAIALIPAVAVILLAQPAAAPVDDLYYHYR
jgi:hypothetical protein